MFNKLSDLHKLCFPRKPWSAADFADLKKSGCEIIASENGFIVWRTVGPETEIITIGVHPDARGGGIASAMLTLMENEILKNGACSPPLEGCAPLQRRGTDTPQGGSCPTKIFLEVAADNTAARRLYEQHGYVAVGTRPKYYDGVDAIIMEKGL